MKEHSGTFFSPPTLKDLSHFSQWIIRWLPMAIKAVFRAVHNVVSFPPHDRKPPVAWSCQPHQISTHLNFMLNLIFFCPLSTRCFCFLIFLYSVGLVPPLMFHHISVKYYTGQTQFVLKPWEGNRDFDWATDCLHRCFSALVLGIHCVGWFSSKPNLLINSGCWKCV